MNSRITPLDFIFTVALAALVSLAWVAYENAELRGRDAALDSQVRELTMDNLALRSINALLLETISRKEMTVRVAIDKRDSNGRKL